MKIFCFGDSITYGGSNSWVRKLRKYMEEEGEKDSASVYNLGIKGDSSRELLQRFEEEFDARDSERDCLLIFQIGMNDSQFIKTKDDTRIQKEEFKQNLADLWFKAKQRTDNMIFLGLTPVVDSKTDPVDWDTNKAYRTEYIREYEDKLYELCQEKDVKFVELYDQFLENGYGDLLRDGVHPNEKGHQLIFERIKSKLRAENVI